MILYLCMTMAQQKVKICDTRPLLHLCDVLCELYALPWVALITYIVNRSNFSVTIMDESSRIKMPFCNPFGEPVLVHIWAKQAFCSTSSPICTFVYLSFIIITNSTRANVKYKAYKYIAAGQAASPALQGLKLFRLMFIKQSIYMIVCYL